MTTGWQQRTFRDVLEIRNGRSQKDVKSDNGEYPILGSAGNVMGYATDYICDEGTTIIGRKGNINLPVYVEQKFWNVDTAFGLSPKEGLDNKFLYYYCLHFDFASMNRGTTIPSLIKTELFTVKIPLPLLPEQNRIVAILDEAFAGIDQAIANTERNLANARELFDSKKLTVFEKIDQDSKKPLTEICDAIFAGGDAPKNKMSKVRTGEFDVPIYANAVKNRGLYGYTSEARAKAPSITVAARGSGTGHVEIRSEPFLPIVRLIVLTPMSEMIQPEYFYHALKSLEILRSGSAIPQLTVPMMKSYAIPVPSLAEQNEIVEQINKIASETKTLNEVYCNKLGALGELKQSLLQKAFTGELTADWRKQHSTTNAL